MAPNILVVDRNEAFATMLRQMLETDGGYQVEVAHTGSDALALLQQRDFDLTIVDMDLDPTDKDYRQLILNVRELRPTMRLMLIPLMGKDLSPEARQLGIQGVLSKPFFVDDLLPDIREVLAKGISPPSLRPSAPSPPPGSVEHPASEVRAVLAELARETNADATLLVSYATDKQDVLAHSGVLDDAGAEALAGLVVAIVLAGRAAAHFLGQSDRPFKHNMLEGESLRLHVMTLSESLLLVVVAPTRTPLGTIRHNMRRAGRDLAGRALT